MPKLAVVVTARPSFARIRTVLDALGKRPVDVRLIMAGSALLHHYGEVVKDCPFPVAHRVYSTLDGHTLRTTATETGLLAIHLSHIFGEEQPDAVVTIADRHETLATAIAASYQHIPLVHIQGGERTGSIDDKVRDAVSMLSDLHLTATVEARARLKSMGVKGYAVTTGCPSVDIAAKAVVQPEYADTVVVLQHPVTGEVDRAREQAEETFRAVAQLDRPVLWFWPGQDAGSEDIAKRLREHKDRVDYAHLTFVRHMPAERFLSLMKSCACLVGNSSVGIRECSFLGTPVVNIGSRQDRRKCAENVMHATHNARRIAECVTQQVEHGRYAGSHLYGHGNAGEIIADILVSYLGRGPGADW